MSHAQPPAESARILFVDDEPSIQRAFVRSVRSAGFVIDTASNADEAMRYVRTHDYAVVAADMRMPDTCGLDLITQMRMERPQACYFLVTGDTTIDWPNATHSADLISQIIFKPWQPEALLTALTRGVTMHRARTVRQAGSSAVSMARPAPDTLNTILVAEADGSDRQQIGGMLKQQPYSRLDAVQVGSLHDALDYLRRSRVRAVLLDLALPDGQGLETVARILEVAPEAPIVVMSGAQDQGLAIQSLHAGAQDYLVKGEIDAKLLTRSIRYAIERKSQQDRLTQLAYYDQLTGLPNRLLFQDRLRQALARAERAGTLVGLMFLDLDQFKAINDSMGHDAGDALLRNVAKQLQLVLRTSDTMARLGGDEFVVIVEDLTTPDLLATVARRLLQALEDPVDIAGQKVFCTASIGISAFPLNAKDIDQLSQQADTAMYRAKEAGRGTYRFYSESMHEHALERLKLEQELRTALDNDEFVLHYQPVIDMRSGAVSGVEALLRWARGGGSELVSPAVFIPVLEDTGMIVQVGAWVLQEACRQVKAWADEDGLDELVVSVNLSARQFQAEDVLVRSIQQALGTSGLDPALLELELTESLLFSNSDKTRTVLRTLKNLGTQIAIDDFGTGYSCLSYLKRFPIDRLKLDRSFVHDIPGDRDAETIAKAIIGLGQNLRLKVTAEGVETEEQLAFLRRQGADTAQGFYYTRPMPAEQMARWYHNHQSMVDPAAVAAAELSAMRNRTGTNHQREAGRSLGPGRLGLALGRQSDKAGKSGGRSWFGGRKRAHEEKARWGTGAAGAAPPSMKSP